MRAAFSSLVSASLLVHALFGCCWHHAQACAFFSAEPVAAEPGDCCHHGAAPSEHQSPSPCDKGTHCEGGCTYLPAPKSQVEMPRFLSPSDFVAILPVGTDAPFCAMRPAERSPKPHILEPPLRLHLLHQQLLI